MKDMTASIKLNEAARHGRTGDAGRAIEGGVVNRVIRVRTNCPAAGYIRSVEVLGTAADTAGNRCMTTGYPFPPADTDIMTRPNFDGPGAGPPERSHGRATSFQFSPDGTAMMSSAAFRRRWRRAGR